jgi:hypothetical protein
MIVANARKNAEQWEKILEAAEKQGLLVERPGDRYNGDGSKKRSRHIRITDPATGNFITVANTPSDWRALKNDIAWMRRDLNFIWQGRGSSVPPEESEPAPDKENSDQPARPAEARQERTQRHARSRRRR